MLPVPGVGRNELNGGFSALFCATCHAWHWWCLGEGAAVAVDGGGSVSTGRGAEPWACAGAAPGMGRLWGAGDVPCCCCALAVQEQA